MLDEARRLAERVTPTCRRRRSTTRDPRADERQPLPLRRLRRTSSPAIARRRRAMKPFALRARRPTPAARGRALAARRGARFLGGGTNLVDLMKLGVATPDAARRRHAPAARRDRGAARRRRCASAPAVRNSDLAADPLVRERYPVLAAGAARRRLRPAAQPGHRRRQPAAAHPLRLLPGRHEAVQQARARARAARRARASTATSRSSAHSEHCVATHPSDMAVALAALDARGARARRRRASARSRSPSLHRLPGDEPERDTVLEPGELITAVELPPLPSRRARRYRKVRDRASFAFALVSVAAALDVDDGAVRDVPHRARRRRARAVAGARAPRTALRGAPADRGGVRRARPTPSSPRPRPLRDNALQGAAGAQRCSCARSRELAEAPMTARRRRAIGARARPRRRAATKVTGQARYAVRAPGRAASPTPRSCSRTIAAGAIARDRRRARRSALPGVLAVLTHDNAPRLAERRRRRAAPSCSRPTSPTAARSSRAVVAETLEVAREAAGARARRLRRRAARRRAARRPPRPLHAGARSTPASRPTPARATSTAALAAAAVDASTRPTRRRRPQQPDGAARHASPSGTDGDADALRLHPGRARRARTPSPRSSGSSPSRCA